MVMASGVLSGKKDGARKMKGKFKEKGEWFDLERFVWLREVRETSRGSREELAHQCHHRNIIGHSVPLFLTKFLKSMEFSSFFKLFS